MRGSNPSRSETGLPLRVGRGSCSRPTPRSITGWIIHAKQLPHSDLRNCRVASRRGIGSPTLSSGIPSISLPLCSAFSLLSDGEDLDYRWAVKINHPDQASGHGAASRKPGIMDARPLSRFHLGRVPLVGSGNGADRLHAVLGTQPRKPKTSTFTRAIPVRGITNGVAGSLTILPLIIGEDSRYAPAGIPS